MGIETKYAVWCLVFRRLELSDVCKLRATCKAWYRSETFIEIAKYMKADPWIMYTCPGVADLFDCGLRAWRLERECSLVTNSCALDQLQEYKCSDVAHWTDKDFKYEDWHSRYASYQSHLFTLSLGKFQTSLFYEVCGTSSGLAMILFPRERKIVLSTPLVMKGKFKILPQPDYVNLGNPPPFEPCDEPVCVEEHKNRFYVIVVNQNDLYKQEPDVYLDVVEVYDSRTGSWREGEAYLFGTNVQHPCTQFKLGEFLMLNRDRERVATYDVEQDSWREYEFYSLLPKLDNEELDHYVLKVKKYDDTKLLVVAVVTVVVEEMYCVKGDLSVWIIEVGSAPLQLFNLDGKEMARQGCTVDDMKVFVAGGCVVIGFYSRVHLPDIVYDFELRRLYSCVNSDCRRLTMRTVVRPCMYVGGNKILPSHIVKKPAPVEDLRKRKRQEKLLEREKKLRRIVQIR